jgi:mitochondrial fission protein ELM1
MQKTLGMSSQNSESTSKTIYILCDKGKIGTLRQCEAVAYPLAKHFKATVAVVDVNLPVWFRFFTPRMIRHWPIKYLPYSYPSAPFLTIAAGRQAVVLASPFAKNTPTIALLNPKCPTYYFSAVIPPRHDNFANHVNIIETLGSLHPHNAASFNTTDSDNNFYTITVLLGGNSKHYTYKDVDFINIGMYLKQKAATKKNIRFLISPSRRTPQKAIEILKSELLNVNVTIWNGSGINPYFNYLGAADEILVTGDSISMISEVCYMGKPVEIWRVPIKNKRFLHFYNDITANKHAVFAQEKWPDQFIPLQECDRIIPKLMQILKNQGIT